MSIWLALKYTKSLLRDWVLPPAGPLLVIFIAVGLLRRAPRAARALILAAAAALWLLSTPIVADWLSAAVELYAPLDLQQPTHAQAIVILGGGGFRFYAPEYGGPDAEPFMLERLAYGAYVAQRTGLPILVTGYHEEATAMSVTLERHFAIRTRWVEDQSYDTFENASNSVRMLRADGVERIILVTRATHLVRSTHEFIAAGIQVVPAPVNVQAPRDHLPFKYFPEAKALIRSHDALYEALGDLVRRTLELTQLRHH